MAETTTILLDLTKEELGSLLAGMGQPPYRRDQIFDWLHKKRVESFGEMTNLPLSLRQALEEKCAVGRIKIKKRLVSSIDGTVKYLYALGDGGSVEGVLMRHHHGNSLCISTQAGCRMGCSFCASTLGGLERNLTAGEMLGEVYAAQQDSGEKISSIVLMGIGEPLDNFENVTRFLDMLSHPDGFGMSLRHLSLSTCGLVDGIYRLAEKEYPLTLSVSLHAPEDGLRSRLMPINKKHDIAALLKACRDYFKVTGRRVSFEYALIDGENDTPRHARELAALLRGMNCHVNLIPHNKVAEREYGRSGPKAVARFRQELEEAGITATVRRELGADVSAACGQLRRESAPAETTT